MKRGKDNVTTRLIRCETIRRLYDRTTLCKWGKKIFDVKPYADGGWWDRLKDPEYFKTVKVVYNWTVEWEEGHDIEPGELYEGSVLIS